MSLTLGLTQIRELTEEEVRKLVDEVLRNPSEYSTEAKLILRLDIKNRRRGCGYVYLFSDSMEIVYGDAEIITILSDYDNCTEHKELLVIPKTVPTVMIKKHFDENPESPNYTDVYIFTVDGWKWVTTRIPK